MSTGFRRKFLMSIGALAMACAMPAYALEVGGVKIDDTASVGGKTLVLNGAAMRQILLFKVYAIGLYVEKKSSSAAEILAATGPKRITLAIQREINSDEFGQLFITSMNKNSTKEEKAKVVAQTTKFGEIFAEMGVVKKGDTVWLDWIPAREPSLTSTANRLAISCPTMLSINQYCAFGWVGTLPNPTSSPPCWVKSKV